MIGQTISHYKIVEKLGEGGMGVVYRAEDTKLRRSVALKFLPPTLLVNEDDRRRFVHEAQASAALSHPNIATVFEIDESESRTFIALEYIEGQSLAEKIKSGPLKLDDTLSIAFQICEGLQAAHEKGIVHRDIKSQNIMVTSKGQVKILDFGLAKLRGASVVTKAGTSIGTMGYMSPEQLRGESVDHRTDIWAMGVVLYEMIAGRRPFQGDYDEAIAYQIMNQQPEPLTAIRTGVPIELERIVARALSKSAADRYQHADELIAVLRSLQRELAGETPAMLSGTKKRTPRTKAQLLVAGIAFLAVIGIATYFVFMGKSGMQTMSASTAQAKEWKNSIAVLPLRDYSPGKDQEFFCDGMTDAIINRLSHFRELKVISTTSAMCYRRTEKDIKTIGQELGVANIIEGTVQREANRIRIRAQLINTGNGFQVWSNMYDRTLESVFDLQDEISKSIAEALSVTLGPATVNISTENNPRSLQAYEHYVKGMHFIKTKYVLSFREEDFKAGVEMFKKAIELDSTYALAYFGLLWAYEHHYQATNNVFDRELAERYCETSWRLDPNSALINAGMGYMCYEYQRDYTKAFEYFRKALELNPNLGEVNFLVGMCYLYLGLYETGIKYLSKSIELDPFYFWGPYKLASCYMRSGQFEKAVQYYDKYFELAPIEPLILPGQYASLNIMMRRYDKVEEILRKGEKTDPNAGWVKRYRAVLFADKGEKQKALTLYKNSEVYALLGMNDEAIKCLQEEIRGKVEWPYTFHLDLANSRYYDKLRGDPRFVEIVKTEKRIYEETQKKFGEL
jgi:non-specific serine/threonine protein kinase